MLSEATKNEFRNKLHGIRYEQFPIKIINYQGLPTYCLGCVCMNEKDVDEGCSLKGFPMDALSYKNNMLVDSDRSQILATCSRDINYKCGGTLRTPCLKEQKNALLRIEDTLILYANQKHVSFSK